VKIVEIRGETKPVNRSLNIFLDVGSRVGHLALGAKDVESTF
jgi:hypothetical protein